MVDLNRVARRIRPGLRVHASDSPDHGPRVPLNKSEEENATSVWVISRAIKCDSHRIGVAHGKAAVPGVTDR
jgi:hypothetical protein